MAFYLCKKLKSITYRGSISDYKNNVNLGYRWIYDSAVAKINCTDGEIPISINDRLGR